MLFQLDGFTAEAAQSAFSINVPLRLAKRYGASAYASLRRYVSHSDRTCVLIVLNPIILGEPFGFSCGVRRIISSPSFDRQFGKMTWPVAITPNESLGHLVPLARRMTGARQVKLTDNNGEGRPFIAEAFKTTHQVFILLHTAEAKVHRLIIPGRPT